MIKKAILFIFILLSLNSCSSLALYAYKESLSRKDNINSQKTTLHLKVFQTINSELALALTNNFDTLEPSDCVAIYSRDIVLYDGRGIQGKFVLVDTYTYNSKTSIQKTVPVFMPWKEYRKYGYPPKYPSSI